MIEIVNLSKRFGSFQVLKELQLAANASECMALIGPNGCGKTTLIKCILGLVKADSGNILVKGNPIVDDVLYRRQIGYMPQISNFPENMTIRELLKMIKTIRKDITIFDEELFESFGISIMLDKKLVTLSGGTAQKISAVIAFLCNPDILILDEPTAGLDPLSAEILKNKISKTHASGKLVLVTSHLLNELDDLVTHVTYMQEGKIIFKKQLSELLKDTKELKIAKAITSFLKQQEYA